MFYKQYRVFMSQTEWTMALGRTAIVRIWEFRILITTDSLLTHSLGSSDLMAVQASHSKLHVKFSWVIIHYRLVVKDGTSTRHYLWHVTSYIVSILATSNPHQWHEFIRYCQTVSYRVCWIRPYESSSWPFDIFDSEQFKDVTRNLRRYLPDLTAPKGTQTL